MHDWENLSMLISTCMINNGYHACFLICFKIFTITLVSDVRDCWITLFSGLGWSYPCDMWSIGCILVELLSVGIPSCSFIWFSFGWVTFIRDLSTLCICFRGKLFFKHMKIWSIWPWWRGFWDQFQNTWYGKRGSFPFILPFCLLWSIGLDDSSTDLGRTESFNKLFCYSCFLVWGQKLVQIQNLNIFHWASNWNRH